MIYHQLRTGGDPDVDVYTQVPWLEFKERPDQPDEELHERWKAMPADVPRGFKSHAAPGPFLEYKENLKYIVVYRNPEEACVSLFPFFKGHNPDLFKLWGAEGMYQGIQSFPGFPEFFNGMMLNFNPGPPGAPAPPDGMLSAFFSSFLSAWWPLRNKPNVLMLHFNDMKKDHEGTVQKIAAHCGFTPTAEQWPKVMEYTSFKWMKEHSVAFEAANLAPVPVMAEGTMIRKGESGKANEDGMTPEISAVIRAHMDKYVDDPVAVAWAYAGGPIPAD